MPGRPYDAPLAVQVVVVGRRVPGGREGDGRPEGDVVGAAASALKKNRFFVLI